jgi:rhodanese-related sulfurtransferase
MHVRVQPEENHMESQRITVDEAKRRLDSGETVVFLDSRSDAAWRKAELQIPKSVRVPPDGVEAHLDEIPRRGLIVPYCT